MCNEIYVENGTLAIALTDEFYTVSLLAQEISGSKQAALIKSPLNIFELQQSPCFVVQNGGSLPNLPIVLAWEDAFRTTEWEKIYPFPDVSVRQIRYLLTLA